MLPTKPVKYLVFGVIKESFTYLDNYMFSLLYKSVVPLHLEYANEAWGPYYVTNCNNVESVQSRWIPELPNLPYHTIRFNI